MVKGFKDFLMRGNAVDLAVAVVIGAAFSQVIAGLREGLLDPLIAAVAGEQDLRQVGGFTWNQVDFSIGIPLTAGPLWTDALRRVVSRGVRPAACCHL